MHSAFPKIVTSALTAAGVAVLVLSACNAVTAQKPGRAVAFTPRADPVRHNHDGGAGGRGSRKDAQASAQPMGRAERDPALLEARRLGEVGDEQTGTGGRRGSGGSGTGAMGY